MNERSKNSEKSPTHLTVEHANIRPSREGLPVSEKFNDFYYSTDDALAEKTHVFIAQNNIVERIASTTRSSFNLCELGFGTGLNFLLTVNALINNDAYKNEFAPHLRYIAVEQFPLTHNQLKVAADLWPALSEVADMLLEVYPQTLTQGFHHLVLKKLNVSLTLVVGEAGEALKSLSFSRLTGHCHNSQVHMGCPQTLIDAWYFDGFSPAKNPDIWSEAIFTLAANLSHSGTTYATYTSASKVRKAIEKAGFSVNKTEGFGKKREMIFGFYQDSNAHLKHLPPLAKNPPSFRKKNSASHTWHLINDTSNAWAQQPKTAIVIGAGLAGAHIANALAKRNIHVTVFEKGKKTASGASGNKQGVVYTKLSHSQDHLSVFNIQAQLFSDRFYHAQNIYSSCGQACGVVHLATCDKEVKNYKALCEAVDDDTKFLWLDDVSPVTGVQSHYPGLWVKDSGWIDLPKLCEQLLNHKNITVKHDVNVTQLSGSVGDWRAVDIHSKHVGTAEVVIVSNAYDAANFEQLDYIKTKKIRGQVTFVPQTENSSALRTALCGHGYIAPAPAPAQDAEHCIGATFNLHNSDEHATLADQNENLKNLTLMSAELSWNTQLTNVPLMQNRVAFRCATQDYFPIVGPVPCEKSFISTFGELRSNATSATGKTCDYHHGLYVNIGYGSRGLAYAPIATCMLVHQILGEPLPVSEATARQLHPGRFLFRDLTRNRI